MLMPKRVKYRKAHRGRRAGKAYRGHNVDFGDFGLKAQEAGWITSRQIEACRVAITRKMKRDGKVWIRIFPDKPVTKKPLETRMGNLEYAMALGLVLISITIIIYSFVYLLNNRSVK